ncbi:MAG: DUF6913 domain-containing protein [Gammaproteobacteria bacterium]
MSLTILEFWENSIDIYAQLEEGKEVLKWLKVAPRIFDLLINVDTANFNVFKKELKKYLKILKFIT